MQTQPYFLARAPRHTFHSHFQLEAALAGVSATVLDLSTSGLGCKVKAIPHKFQPGQRLPQLTLRDGGTELWTGSARIARIGAADEPNACILGLAFERDASDLLESLAAYVVGSGATSDEVSEVHTVSPNLSQFKTLDSYADFPSKDVLEKTRNFQSWTSSLHDAGYYQRFYRLRLKGPVDHRITVQDFRGHEKSLICFDSNSYLGLHLHPRVLETVQRAVQTHGYGTPSAQLLCGTNDLLVELEDALAEFHQREAAMVFPSGFAANVGILRALLRPGDAVFRDQHAHASIHEGCRKAGAEKNRVFAHNDMAYLEKLLKLADRSPEQGKLVATDGVFSMHGELSPLPELSQLCKKYDARLMVDDAHGLGVIGGTGGGIEEHYGCVGAADVLMGTLSKTLGALGGYVTGSRDLIDYMRWFAPSGLFTTTLPAPVCAGATMALKILREEPEHRQNLHSNLGRFVAPLAEAGLRVSGTQSPIVTVFVGKQELLWRISRDLYEAGIKAGNVIYPAVPREGCILRFTMNSRHRPEEIDQAVTTLIDVSKKHGLLG